MRKTLLVATILLACFATTCLAYDHDETEHRLAQAEQQLAAQEHQLEDLKRTLEDLKEESGIAFMVLFLFGLVLSIWAMNRQRSGCTWFILGFIPMVNIIAGLIALSTENAHHKSRDRPE